MFLTKYLVKENLEVIVLLLSCVCILSLTLAVSSTPQQILTVDKPKPKDVSSPPQVKQQQKGQANQATNGSVPTASVATSSSPALSSTNNVVTQAAAPAQSLAPVRAADSQNGSNDGFSSHSRGQTSESGRSPPSASSIRRYDSKSLLSDNSIASSRFDISDGASYPEAIRKHKGSFGEIHLTVRYATLRNKLIILVNACRYARE
uniref:extended synaptotagmin-3-like n=1 Tax=Monopterus albus TaxID=43700 RepID=UPI0009B3A845